MPAFQDLTGQKFGRLTVIELAEKSKAGRTKWLCRCDCGSETKAIANNLKMGSTKSCGCQAPVFQDLTGQEFGSLTVVSQAGIRNNRIMWSCRCACGSIVIVAGHLLKSGNTKSCGCTRRNNPALGFLDITGQKFGRLTVIERAGNNGKTTRWLCRCDCGELCKIGATSLRQGHSKSCGCLSVELTVARSTTHGCAGRSRTVGEYSIWSAMRQRCNNPKDPAFKNYGGRGIKVCDRWDDSFENFIKDMGMRPFQKASLERLDNSAGYSKTNCVWTTRKAQARNTRTNRIVAYKGVSKTVAEWAEEIGMDYDILHNRLTDLNWTVERAFETPPRRCKR